MHPDPGVLWSLGCGFLGTDKLWVIREDGEHGLAPAFGRGMVLLGVSLRAEPGGPGACPLGPDGDAPGYQGHLTSLFPFDA